MDVTSLCPLRVGGLVWQSRSGAHALTVLAKATFDLEPGESRLAREQEALNEADNHWNDDPARSVYAPSDQAPLKARADVVLVGNAFAPGQQPVRSLMTRMVIGSSIDKSIEVWCDRGYRVTDRQLLEGPRFVKMPLRWERAAGGPETNNPVGMRFDAAPDRYGMVSIPNLQPPGTYVSRGGETFAPVGYGPIAASWPGRTMKLGHHAGSFSGPAWEGRPLPGDLEPAYFNMAPPDQQADELRANERIVLENLHPEHARLVTSLPGVKPWALVERASGVREGVELVADTLWIDTDRGICTLVWRGRLWLRDAREAGRVTVWMEDRNAALVVGGMGSPSGGEDVAVTTTLEAPLRGAEQPVLPFTQGTSKLSNSELRAALDAAFRWRAQAGPAGGTGTEVAPAEGQGGDTLPFVRGDRSADLEDAIATLVPQLKAVEPVPPPVRFGPGALMGENPSVGPAPVAPAFVKELQPSAAEHREAEAPAPPPMIGPLVPEKEPAPEAPTVEAGATPSGEAETEVPAPIEPPKPAPLPLEKYPLERCAAIAASIERTTGKMERILKDEGLEGKVWEALHAHWLDAVEADVDRGRKKMLSAYDAAYVERLEKERGPITAAEYASLLLAAERRGADAELRKLDLPEGSMMRIRRVWLARTAKNAAVAAEVRAAMRAAMQG
jgi:hypothetical protein